MAETIPLPTFPAEAVRLEDTLQPWVVFHAYRLGQEVRLLYRILLVWDPKHFQDELFAD